jgi:hypothetical protein
MSEADIQDKENDDSYNRIRLPSDLRHIYLQIADSSESIPLTEEEEDGTTYTPSPVQKAPTSSSTTSAQGSKLSQSFLSSDFPTPTPERPNPLEQVPTTRDNGASAAETPSPVRSHELAPTHTNPLARRISNMITEEDSELEGEDKSVSRQTTASRGSGEGKRPKMQGRPSTMRRIGSALKKTMSKDTKS